MDNFQISLTHIFIAIDFDFDTIFKKLKVNNIAFSLHSKFFFFLVDNTKSQEDFQLSLLVILLNMYVCVGKVLRCIINKFRKL